MDGVITDSMPYHYRAWKNVFRANGLNVSKFDVYRREGQKGTESIQEIFAETGVTISSRQAIEIIAAKERLFKQIIRLRFIPWSRSLIRDLHRNNVRLALVTGTSRQEVEHTLTDDLLNKFEVTITGSDVVSGKPHPEPYLKALELLHIASSEGIVIENAPFGIISAKTAGIKCYAVATSLPFKFLGQADKVFNDLKSLRATLFKDLKIL